MISHLNKKNKPTIIDISAKKITNRIAIAQGIIQFSESTFKEIVSLKTKKGEIENIAIIAWSNTKTPKQNGLVIFLGCIPGQKRKQKSIAPSLNG